MTLNYVAAPSPTHSQYKLNADKFVTLYIVMIVAKKVREYVCEECEMLLGILSRLFASLADS